MAWVCWLAWPEIFQVHHLFETIMGGFLKDTSAIKMPDWRFTLDHMPAHYIR